MPDPIPAGALTPDGQPTAQSLIANAKQPAANLDTTSAGPSQADLSHDSSGDFVPQHGGFLGKVEGALVNAGGRPTPGVSFDDHGDMQAAASAASPGQLFKNLLIGSLTGLAAATRNPRGGMLGAVGNGFVGGMQEQQQQAELNRENAVEQFKVKQEAQKNQFEQNAEQQRLDLQQKEYAANNAHWNIDNMRNQHMADLQQQDHLEKLNEVNDNVLDKALDAGGHTIAIKDAQGNDINGKNGNGTALMQWYAQPGNAKSPSGGVLKLVSKYDTDAMNKDGIHYDIDKGFYTDKDGNRADISPYVSNTVVDVPPNSMNQIVHVSRAEMKRYGVDTNSNDTTMTLGQQMAYAKAYQERLRQSSDSENSKQLGLLAETENNLARLAAERDKVLSDPNNAMAIAAGKGSDLTKSIDQEYSQQAQVRDNILRRFNMTPRTPAMPNAPDAQKIDPNSLPMPKDGYVSVQIPGQMPGTIPASALADFKKKYPNAAVREAQAESAGPAGDNRSQFQKDWPNVAGALSNAATAAAPLLQ